MSHKDLEEMRGYSIDENEVIERMLLILSVKPGGITERELMTELFPQSQGNLLEHILLRSLSILIDENIIRVEHSPDGLKQYGRLVFLTGKGLKILKVNRLVMTRKPYAYWRMTAKIEALILKGLPIALSVAALIVSIATCQRTR